MLGAHRTVRGQMLRLDGPDTLRRDGRTERVGVDRELPVRCLGHGGSLLDHIAGLRSSESCSGKGRRAHDEIDRVDNRPGRVHATCGADGGPRKRRGKRGQQHHPRGERLHLPGASLSAWSPPSCRPDPGLASGQYCASSCPTCQVRCRSAAQRGSTCRNWRCQVCTVRGHWLCA